MLNGEVEGREGSASYDRAHWKYPIIKGEEGAGWSSFTLENVAQW